MATNEAAQIKQQLALAIQCNEEISFADFCWAGNEFLQQQFLSLLSQSGQIEGRVIYIWGVPGSGKSHLLQAGCQASAQEGASTIYLPLKLLHTWAPAVLEGMSEHDWVAVDDVEEIAGNPAWEEALFHLYNQIQIRNKILIIAGQVPPRQTRWHLADLRSRLTHALILQIHELSDENKINILQGHALQRGLDLSKQVGHYILSRCARNMHDLLNILDRLDHASLVEQRKLTLPFVKNILGV